VRVTTGKSALPNETVSERRTENHRFASLKANQRGRVTVLLADNYHTEGLVIDMGVVMLTDVVQLTLLKRTIARGAAGEEITASESAVSHDVSIEIGGDRLLPGDGVTRTCSDAVSDTIPHAGEVVATGPGRLSRLVHAAGD